MVKERWSLDRRNGDHTSSVAECVIGHVINQAHVRVPIMGPDTNFSVRL